MLNREIAREYMSYGLNPVPVSSGKIPSRKGHSTNKISDSEIDSFDFSLMGVSTGVVSLGLEALDFDLKNSVSPKEVLKSFKLNVDGELLKRLVVQSTPSGGYHFLYRCEEFSASRKLAMSVDDEVIIETRGAGAYIKCYPSKGYNIIQGSFDKIPTITPEERLQLLISCQMVNSNIAKDRFKKQKGKYLGKFPKYDEDYTVGIKLLESHGWKVLKEDVSSIYLERPGKDQRETSAQYFLDGNFFYCYSTSTSFEEKRPYNNHALFAELECDGNYSAAYAKLRDDGYASQEFIDNGKTVEEEEWDHSLESLAFLSDRKVERTYLNDVVQNNVPLGLSTGWKSLDKYYRIKRNSFNVGLGFDGCGKSLYKISAACADFTLHKGKTAFCMPENKTAMSRRRVIEALSGKPIEYFNGRLDEYKYYERIAYDNFYIINNKKHWTIIDVVEMGKKLVEVHGVTNLVIDPYNFFKPSGGDLYRGNNDVLSQLRVFSEKYCSVDLMAHPRSEATRSRLDSEGYLEPPRSYDIEGGASFPYRVDDFYVLHRKKNHPDKEVRKTMQFIVTKIKEDETGGKVHNLGEYSEMIWDTRDGFTGYYDEGGCNPMKDND
jgi:hypothetical protein